MRAFVRAALDEDATTLPDARLDAQFRTAFMWALQAHDWPFLTVTLEDQHEEDLGDGFRRVHSLFDTSGPGYPAEIPPATIPRAVRAGGWSTSGEPEVYTFDPVSSANRLRLWPRHEKAYSALTEERTTLRRAVRLVQDVEQAEKEMLSAMADYQTVLGSGDSSAEEAARQRVPVASMAYQTAWEAIPTALGEDRGEWDALYAGRTEAMPDDVRRRLGAAEALVRERRRYTVTGTLDVRAWPRKAETSTPDLEVGYHKVYLPEALHHVIVQKATAAVARQEQIDRLADYYDAEAAVGLRDARHSLIPATRGRVVVGSDAPRRPGR